MVEQDGWSFVRQRGSHRQYRHPTKPGAVTISGHPGDDVDPRNLASILRQAQIERPR